MRFSFLLFPPPSLIGLLPRYLKVIRVGRRQAAIRISKTFFWSTLLYSIGTFVYDEVYILFDLSKKWQQYHKVKGGNFIATVHFQQALIKTG